MIRVLLFIVWPFFVLLPSNSFAQLNLNKLVPTDYDNIMVHKLNTDKLSTSFVIWVKKSVGKHVHKKHDESILVLEGTGQMYLEGDTVSLIPGVYVYIPQKAAHSVKVSSKTPLKVLSIQTPEFFGKDREFID